MDCHLNPFQLQEQWEHVPGKDFREPYPFNLPQLFGQGLSREFGRLAALGTSMSCSRPHGAVGQEHFQKLQTGLIPRGGLIFSNNEFSRKRSWSPFHLGSINQNWLCNCHRAKKESHTNPSYSFHVPLIPICSLRPQQSTSQQSAKIYF